METWGIWNSVEKRFVFGIKETSARKAMAAFKKEVGKTSYKYRYAPKIIPEGFKNPPNKWYK